MTRHRPRPSDEFDPLSTPVIDSHSAPLAARLRMASAEAMEQLSPNAARGAIAATRQAIHALEAEMAKARAVEMLIMLAKAFEERPEVDAIYFWARGAGFNIGLGKADPSAAPGHDCYETISEYDNPLSPNDDDYEPNDNGAFHLAFDFFLDSPHRAPWSYDDDSTDWIPRGSPLQIGVALGMAWLPSWIESGALDDCSHSGGSRADAPRL